MATMGLLKSRMYYNSGFTFTFFFILKYHYVKVGIYPEICIIS